MTDIIISNYNYLKFLPECIKSCLGQGRIIIVDDCSTDGSVEYSKTLPAEIITVGLLENSGVSVVRNEGLKCSTSEFIQILDADDLLIEGSVGVREKVLKENPELDAVYGITLKLKDGKTMAHRSEFATHSILFRRRVFEKYGLFYEGLRTKEDKEFKYRIGLHEKSYQKDKIKAKKIDKPVAVYRRHEGAKRRLRSKDLKMDIETYMEFDKRCKDIEINGITEANTRFL